MTRRDGTRVPSNLSLRALDDLRYIFQYSRRHFAPAITRRTRARLVERFTEIDERRAVGFVRSDIDGSGRTLFVIEPPWLIAFSPDTGQVLRIVHGSRDLPVLFADGRS